MNKYVPIHLSCNAHLEGGTRQGNSEAKISIKKRQIYERTR
jgi:hypothetical protein